MVKSNKDIFIYSRHAKRILLLSILILTSLDNHLEKLYYL